MVYIRKDRRGDKIYFWLVESHREGQRVKQTRIKSLGTTEPTPETRDQLIKEYSEALKATSEGVKKLLKG